MKKEGVFKIVYMAFWFSLFASLLVAGLFFAFISFCPFDELVRLLEKLFANPGVISAAIFAEMFLILFIIEIFRLVFEAGAVKKVKETSSTEKKTKTTTKKTKSTKKK